MTEEIDYDEAFREIVEIMQKVVRYAERAASLTDSERQDCGRCAERIREIYAQVGMPFDGAVT